MTTYKHTLKDVIECCVWQPDMPPRDLQPPPEPYSFDDDERPPPFSGRANKQDRRTPPSETMFGERVLAALVAFDAPVTASAIASITRRLEQQVSHKLRLLEAEGIVERVVSPGLALRWKKRTKQFRKPVLVSSAA